MRRLRISIFIISIILLSVQAISAQPYKDSRYGVDSVSRMKCAEQLSTLSEFMKIDLYGYALDAFQYTIGNCPASSKNIYIHGAKIYKYYIEKENDPSIRKRKVDSLLMIYDMRMQYFKEEGIVSGRKGLDMLKYTDDVSGAYALLKKSFESLKEKTEDAIIINLMQAAQHLRKNGTIAEDEYLLTYGNLVSVLEKRLASNPGDDKAVKTLENINALFASGDPANCESLTGLFSGGFEANKNEKDWLKRVVSLLEGSKCQETPFYAQCAEQLFQLIPTADAAFSLYSIYSKDKDDAKAKYFILKSIELESDPVKKSKYYLAYGILLSRDNTQYKEARAQALEAIKLNPSWGEPYLFIGNLYASSSKLCGKNEFEQKTVFWLAVDWYQKAKSNDSSIEGEANRLISQYAQYFPNKENAFFYGYTEGNTYTCGCWINETTRVRF